MIQTEKNWSKFVSDVFPNWYWFINIWHIILSHVLQSSSDFLANKRYLNSFYEWDIYAILLRVYMGQQTSLGLG